VLRENWESVLKVIKKMGLPLITTYVPWNYHELERRVYGFEGKSSPQRDLKGFLELSKKYGFYVFLRPRS